MFRKLIELTVVAVLSLASGSSAQHHHHVSNDAPAVEQSLPEVLPVEVYPPGAFRIKSMTG